MLTEEQITELGYLKKDMSAAYIRQFSEDWEAAVRKLRDTPCTDAERNQEFKVEDIKGKGKGNSALPSLWLSTDDSKQTGKKKAQHLQENGWVLLFEKSQQ